jgi:serine/threonine protein kinase
VTDSNLKTLYEWFDRLVDLPTEAQAAKLDSLRDAGDAMALPLEGLLLCHRRQDPTASPFSIDEILRSCDAPQPFRLATDLRDLSQRMQWDEKRRCFRLGQYSLQQCLSVSAVGATYCAHDENLDRDVVILLAFPRWNKKPSILKRMLDSSRAVAKIFHPNVAAILGTLQCGDVSAVVRQWIPGQNLEEWIENRPNVSFSDLAVIGGGIAHGIQAIHNQGVLHGDLKPANIILRDSEIHPVITDFGTAHGIEPDGISEWHGGTRGFVAPEILRGSSPTQQSDLYSLGVVLFWMATGAMLDVYDEFDYAKVWNRCLNRSNIPGAHEGETALGELVLELVGNDPDRRPHSAGLVADALEELRHWRAQSTSMNTPESVEPSKIHSERFHGGSRPLTLKRFRNRRDWMSHAIGLATCASGSAWMGRLAATQLSYTEPVFVPGTKVDFAAPANWDESHFDRSTLVIRTHEPLADISNEEKTYADLIAPRKWITIHSQPIELPTHPISVALFQFRTRFNCNPGMALVRVDVQYDGSSRWIQQLNFRNFFGGCYESPYLVALSKSHVKKSKSVCFRLAIMALQPTIHPDDLPPIGLQLHTSQTHYQMGDLWIWKDLNRPKT